jgi:hypothetical protein
MEIVKVVEKTSNVKLGLASATYAPIQSCSYSCPFKDKGCYAQNSFCGIHLRRLNKAAEITKNTQPRQIARIEAKQIKTLSGKYPLRLHVTGDCRSEAAAETLAKACKSYPNKVWTYTHSWMDIDADTWKPISILASCETKQECEEAYDKGYAPCLVTKTSFDGTKEIDGLWYMTCPNITKHKTCSQCKMCLNSDKLYKAGIVICFPAHGIKKEQVKQQLEV